MTHEALVESPTELPAGEARFIRPSEGRELLLRSEQDGYINVDIPELMPKIRGRLAWLLEEAIERSLELRGASGPRTGADVTLETSLSDQLYRARLLGARGITLVLPTLEGLTSRSGALDAEDSSALRFWICAARSRSVRLYLDVADCMLGAYVDPVTLTHLMNAPSPPEPNSPPVVVHWEDEKRTTVGVPTRPQRSTDCKTATGSAPPISDVVAANRDASPELGQPAWTHNASGEFATVSPSETAPDSEDSAASRAPPPISIPPDTTVETPSLDPSLVPPPPSASIDSAPVSALSDAVDELEEPGLTPIAAPAVLDLERSSSARHELPAPCSIYSMPTLAPPCRDDDANEKVVGAADVPQAPELILPVPHPPTIPAPRLASPAEEQQDELRPHQHEPLCADAPDAWRSWMQRLYAVHGPKPLNFIEQAFVNAYVPLCDAYHRGIAGEECRSVLEQWASSFSQSYGEAFDAMRIRGRRPMMVLDIPETAHRLARLHGARSVQLVLVDAMRFDLGQRVERILSAKLGREAVLTDRFLHWSALPTTTTQQLELIARGSEGLRDGDIHSETPVLVTRGRSASTLRRTRAGSRELLKLDLVEARLSEKGAPIAERLDLLAVEISDALALAIGRMQARTLVMVFGDHGFCLDPVEQGTSPMRHGGASPEEVLVPAYAWLVGQTH